MNEDTGPKPHFYTVDGVNVYNICLNYKTAVSDLLVFQGHQVHLVLEKSIAQNILFLTAFYKHKLF